MHNFQQTSDGGYIISSDAVYEMDPETNLSKGYLIKLDAAGVSQWIKEYNKSDYSVKPSDGCSVFQCADNGYIIATCLYPQNANQGICLIRTDASGNVSWSRLYPGAGTSAAYCVQQTSDNCFIVAGSTLASGIQRAYVLKTDSSGNPLAGKAFTIPSDVWGCAYAIRETTDGGYIVAGGYDYPFLLKLDHNFTVSWEYSFTGETGVFNDVAESPDGGYVACGTVSNNITVVKVTGAGVISWVKAYNTPVAGMYQGFTIRKKPGGGYLISADSWNGPCMAALDNTGNMRWIRILGINSYSVGTDAQPTADGGCALISSAFTPVSLFKTDSSGRYGCSDSLLSMEPVVYSPSAAQSLIPVDLMPQLPATVALINSTLAENMDCKNSFDQPVCDGTDLMVPNVFTPNNDGDNDLFMITTHDCIEKFEILVYNRWGELLFRSADRNLHWNGKTRSGAASPDGTYYYIATADGKRYKGFLSLLR